MHLTNREIWTAVHGMVFGAGFLLLFSAGFYAIWNLRVEHFSDIGLKKYLCRLAAGCWVMVILAWLTVLVGTYWSYPWYRAVPPRSLPAISLWQYPKFYLMSNPQTADWHEFGMEWKEHIAWLVPILLTGVAFVISFHGRLLAENSLLRRTVILLFTVALFSAGVAGLLGAMINKFAPVK
jgi:hypothetical protein